MKAIQLTDRPIGGHRELLILIASPHPSWTKSLSLSCEAPNPEIGFLGELGSG